MIQLTITNNDPDLSKLEYSTIAIGVSNMKDLASRYRNPDGFKRWGTTALKVTKGTWFIGNCRKQLLIEELVEVERIVRAAKFLGCECGAETSGHSPFTVGHSSWCPVSA